MFAPAGVSMALSLYPLIDYLTCKNVTMNLQYISDSTGKTTGVFIPIAEWNELKNKYKGIEQEQIDIPARQMAEVQKRLDSFKNDTGQALDFDTAMNDIENKL